MRKISVISALPARKLVGVVGVGGEGIYLLNNSGGVNYFNTRCMSVDKVNANYSLESVATDKDRTPIYEGDKIEIQF